MTDNLDKSDDSNGQNHKGENSEIDPPEILWHYTTPDGLLGILKEGALRATGLSYLNDVTEGKYLTKLMQEPISYLTSEKDLPAITRLFDSVYRDIGVACLCKNGDLLSQWRGYSANGGFAIGFRGSILKKVWEADSSEGFLRPVEYSSKTSFIRAVVDAREVANRYKDVFPGGIEALKKSEEGGRFIYQSEAEKLEPQLKELFTTVRWIAFNGALHKDSHFSEEDEWRLLTFVKGRTAGGDSEGATVNVGRAGLSVYRTVRFQDSPKASPVCEIRIGPGMDLAAQSQAIEVLLSRLGYRNVKVSGSSVPLRLS